MKWSYRARNKLREGEMFSGPGLYLRLGLILFMMMPAVGHSWTIFDYNPWKQLRESRIFSLTRADPIGTRILVIPVLDDPVNTPVYTRVCTEFTNQLRSFASEVWLITDLPDGPVKQGFYAGLSRILADYRLKNRLSMDLISTMIPDFECDYIALFEVTGYDRYWIDHDLQQRVGLRCVLYDYADGGPRVEKYFQGGRGRRLEEGAYSEAERIAVKGLIAELERPLRESMKMRAEELQRRNEEINELVCLTNQEEWAIHKYDLGVMEGRMAANQQKAAQAENSKIQIERERDYWKQQAESNKEMMDQYRSQLSTSANTQPQSRNAFRTNTRRNPFFSQRYRLPIPHCVNPPSRPTQNPQTKPIETSPQEPPRMPTLQPIGLQEGLPAPPSTTPAETSSVIAFRGFDELPEIELETGSILIPPWENEPQGDWEYVGPAP